MITIEMVKLQCRIEHDDEDALLERYIAAAFEFARARIDDNLTPANTPAAVEQAMLMLIGHWYEHRETVISGNTAAINIPFGVDMLLQPYRKMGV